MTSFREKSTNTRPRIYFARASSPLSAIVLQVPALNQEEAVSHFRTYLEDHSAPNIGSMRKFDHQLQENTLQPCHEDTTVTGRPFPCPCATLPSTTEVQQTPPELYQELGFTTTKGEIIRRSNNEQGVTAVNATPTEEA